MAKQNKEEVACCPVGSCLREFDNAFGRRSKFMNHLTQSRIEVLKGIRSLVDDRIESLNARISGTGKKRKTKIKVE